MSAGWDQVGALGWEGEWEGAKGMYEYSSREPVSVISRPCMAVQRPGNQGNSP